MFENLQDHCWTLIVVAGFAASRRWVEFKGDADTWRSPSTAPGDSVQFSREQSGAVWVHGLLAGSYLPVVQAAERGRDLQQVVQVEPPHTHVTLR